MRFTELDADKRMEILHRLDSIGADSAGYYGDCICVCLPNSTVRPVSETLRMIEAMGLKEKGGSYFPLGSDNPKQTLRHFGPGTAAAPKGNEPSYWLYWKFAPIN